MKESHFLTGVATIVNKLNQLPFDEQDEQLFEVERLLFFFLLSGLIRLSPRSLAFAI
jgi:hypothetical protein